jgi:osmotically-inducible protein OsmY
VEAAQIGVTAKDGVVTLAGTVATLAQKYAAERVAKRIYGVRGVAEEIEVRPVGQGERTDADIAKAVLERLRWDAMVPHDKIKVTVEKGVVTLDGPVGWQFEREAAARAVRYLSGVRGLRNQITLKPTIRVHENWWYVVHQNHTSDS